MTDTPSFWNALAPSQPRLHWVVVDGLRTRVLEAGPPNSTDEAAILLVHGASGHLESFVYTIPALARRRRTIAFDLPSHGYSACPDRPYDVFDYARHLSLVAEALGCGPVSVVGQSLGGAIAARACVEGLLDVRQLVLICSSGWPASLPSDGKNTMRSALTAPSFEVVKARLEHALHCRGPRVDELVDCRYLAYQWGEWDQRVHAFTYHETVEGRRRSLLTEEEWRGIHRPVLLIWGEEDLVIPPATGRALSQLIPKSRLVLVPGTAHNPQFEAPDQVNPVLSDFLLAATSPPPANVAGENGPLS